MTQTMLMRYCSSLLLSFFCAAFIPIAAAAFLLPFTNSSAKAWNLFSTAERKEYQKASNLCRSLASNKYEPDSQGFGVEFNKIDVNSAFEACSTAARYVHASRQDQYRFGRVLDKKKSYKLAEEFYRKSADRGYAPAQANIGNLYHNGFGVGKDYRLAMQWYRKAADQGYAYAQANIGFLYNNGFGVGKDYRLAMQWYRKAADQGDAFSQGSIGILYHNGTGVPKNFKKARFWYRKAAAQGNENAKKNLKILENSERKVASQQQRTKNKAAENRRKIEQLDVGDGVYVQGFLTDELVFVVRINKNNNMVKVRTRTDGYTKWVNISEIITKEGAIVNDVARTGIVIGVAFCIFFPEKCKKQPQ